MKMVVQRFKKWLGMKTMPTEAGRTDPAAGVTITKDMLAAVKEAKELLVSTKEGEPIFKKERNMLGTINNLSLQATKGENSFLQQINKISVHKATWHSALLQIAKEMGQHIDLTEQLTVKISEFQEAFKAEQAAKTAGAVPPDLAQARATAMKAFVALFVEVKTLRNEFDEFKTKANKVLQDIENQRKTALKLKDNLELQAVTAGNLSKTIEQSWTSYQAMLTRLSVAQKQMQKSVSEAEYMLKTYKRAA